MHFARKYIAFYLDIAFCNLMFALHSIIKIMETTANKKSESLTRDERKSLKEYRKQFDTDVACAMAIGIDRNVLVRIMLYGSGAPSTVEKIRAALNIAA